MGPLVIGSAQWIFSWCPIVDIEQLICSVKSFKMWHIYHLLATFSAWNRGLCRQISCLSIWTFYLHSQQDHPVNCMSFCQHCSTSIHNAPVILLIMCFFFNVCVQISSCWNSPACCPFPPVGYTWRRLCVNSKLVSFTNWCGVWGGGGFIWVIESPFSL